MKGGGLQKERKTKTILVLLNGSLSLSLILSLVPSRLALELGLLLGLVVGVLLLAFFVFFGREKESELVS